MIKINKMQRYISKPVASWEFYLHEFVILIFIYID